MSLAKPHALAEVPVGEIPGPGESMALDPPTEEMLIVQSDIEGRKQLLSSYIISGYLRGEFDLDLNNPVHRGIHDSLKAQGKLRQPISTIF